MKEMVEQLSMFGVQSVRWFVEEAEEKREFEEVPPKEVIEVIPFDKNDNVRVIVPDLVHGNSEDHFYLADFAGKRGKVLKVIHKPSLQYELDFDGKFAIIRHEELKYW